MSELTPEQLASRASRIVGFKDEASRQTNISKGYISADKANKLPLDSTGGQKIDQMTQQAPVPMTQPNLKAGLDVAKAASPIVPQEAGVARGEVQKAVETAANTPTFYKPDANNPQVVDSQGNKLTYDQYIAKGGLADFSNTKIGNPPNANQVTPLSPLDQQLGADPGYQQLLADRAEYMSEVNQQGTLLKTYQQLIKQAGIPAIDKELLNTRKIIDGTEDDIRKEVQAASGFATDSQVLALASARNKTLIQNYNNLIATKEMAMQQVNTMVNLAGQDRQFAMQAISQKMNFDQSILEYRDKFINNAKEGYNRIIQAAGYTGLLASLQASGDPNAIGIVERTLGMAPGGMQQIANMEAQAQAAKQKQQDFENSLQLRQLAISGGNLALSRERFEYEKTATVPPTQAQYSAAGFAERVQQANAVIDKLGKNFTGTTSTFGKYLPNMFKSEDRQLFEQAQRNFINAVLRRESGAAISPDEFKSAEIQYFPQPGDTIANLQQKAQNRLIVQNNLINTAGPAFDTNSNDPLGLFQ